MHNNTDIITRSNPSSRTTSPRRVGRAAGFAAGIASSLVAGMVFAAVTTNAASVPDASTFVPITPCRLFDTRPAPFNIGPRSTPIGAEETSVHSVTGTNGNCEIPSNANAVAINAAAVGASAASFVTFFPADAELPTSSNLNVIPNHPPTPNKVDVKLSSTGQVAIYNKFGTVDIIVDIMGYYTAAPLLDLESKITALENAKSFSVAAQNTPLVGSVALDNSATSVTEVELVAPVDGQVVATYMTTATQPDAGERVRCNVDPAVTMATIGTQTFESPGEPGEVATIAGTRMFDVTAGETFTVHVVCDSSDASASLRNTHLTATFTPAAPAQPLSESA